MPLVDMPLAELKKYKPALTRRKDFAAFWTRTLKAALKQPLGVTLGPCDHLAQGIRVSRLGFDGFGGGRITGWCLEPAGRGPYPAVVVYHGYSVRSPGIFHLLPWVYQGMVVLSVDCRGQNGGSTDGAIYPEGRRPGFMTAGILDPETYYYRHVYADCVRALEVAAGMKNVDAGRIGVTGTSQGGGLSLAVSALAPKRVRAAAPCIPYLCHYQRAVDMAEGPYREIGEYVRAWPDRVDRVFETLSYFDNMNLADRIRAKMLISLGLWDSVCPPSTIYAAVNRMKCRKEVVVYHCTGHDETEDWRERSFAFLVGELKAKG